MRDVQAFQEALAEGAQAVEAHLDLLLPAADAYPAVIHEAMRYGALGGGKRLRGILVREAAPRWSSYAASQSDRPGAPARPDARSDACGRTGRRGERRRGDDPRLLTDPRRSAEHGR